MRISFYVRAQTKDSKSAVYVNLQYSLLFSTASLVFKCEIYMYL